METQDFINKSIKVHGDKYSYDKYEYINSRTKVIITCNIHGDFEQMPHQHLLGKGCSLCGKIAMANKFRKPLQNFIDEASRLHNNAYDYTHVVYKNNNIKINIGCKIHGQFYQTPRDHLSGQGCKKCGLLRMAKNNTTSLEEFKSKAIEVHANKYSYENVEFNTLSDKVNITCSEHGSFMQNAASHLIGHGCTKCAIKGFDKNKPGTMYIVYLHDLKLYKVGITNLSTTWRLRKENFTIIQENHYELGYDAFIAEQIFIRDNREFAYKGNKLLKNGGDTEMFTMIKLTNDKAILDERI